MRAARLCVGRDSRVSGPMFHAATVAALQSVGATVIDVGLAPTPTIQLAVEHHHAAGGLAITASHNPIEWNALKFIGPSGLFLDPAEGAAMRRVADGEIARATWDKLGLLETDREAIERHIGAVLGLKMVDVALIRSRKFKVALDCVRGAGGAILPALLDRLGCTVTAINLETDGRFPRAPEPVAANLGELEALVKRSRRRRGVRDRPRRGPSCAGERCGKGDRRRLDARARRAARAPLAEGPARGESVHEPDHGRRGARGRREGGARAGGRGERRREDAPGARRDRRRGEWRRHFDGVAPRPRRSVGRGPHLAIAGRG